MAMMVSVASGLPAGVAYQPVYGLQLDFGTPPPDTLRKRVQPQAGLSGVANRSGAIWTDGRTACTNALASFFVDPVEKVRLLKVPAFMTSAPWREIPFEKRWMADSTRNGEGSESDESDAVSTNNAKRWKETHELIENGLVDGLLRWESDVGSANSSRLPLSVRPSERCPTRADVLNTALASRWNIWDDGPECIDGCFLSQCDAMGQPIAPCCVKRLTADWPEPCDRMPHGCSRPSASLLARKGVVVGDVGKLSTPETVPSSKCPYRGDVANTRPRDRWRIWHDGSPPGKMGKSCTDGCALQNCNHGQLNPCCVRRLRVVKWPVPCEQLRFGCNAASGRDAVTWVSSSPDYPFWMSKEEVDAPFPWLKAAVVFDYHGSRRHPVRRRRKRREHEALQRVQLHWPQTNASGENRTVATMLVRQEVEPTEEVTRESKRKSRKKSKRMGKKAERKKRKKRKKTREAKEGSEDTSNPTGSSSEWLR